MCDCSQAFSIFCGLGIHNTLMYAEVEKAMARQKVAIEVRALTHFELSLAADITGPPVPGGYKYGALALQVGTGLEFLRRSPASRKRRQCPGV
jgi:hypothetical protein